MTGILNGIGVGVGDPDMMTIRAVRMIEGSDVICLPRKERSKCRAYLIAKEVVPALEEKEILCFDFEMTRDEKILSEKHKEICETILPYIKAGKKVSFLTIGDPTVYSTFSYIADLAKKEGIKVNIINGINSFSACAGSLGISLCEGDEELHVFSGTEDTETILSYSGTKVIMKCSGNMAEIKRKLAEEEKKENTGDEEPAILVYGVSECGTEREKTYIGADQLPEDAGYMMTLIIKEKKAGKNS